jgi:hypothetical protein
MGTVEHVLERQRERKERLKAAQAAVQALSPEAREEFLAWLVEEVESETPLVNEVRRQRSRKSTKAPRALKGGKGERQITIRSAILAVLGAGKHLGTSAITIEVRKTRPDAKYATVAAEIMRMLKVGLIVKRGSTGRGAAYGLPNGGGATTAPAR